MYEGNFSCGVCHGEKEMLGIEESCIPLPYQIGVSLWEKRIDFQLKS
jgi:hypothetical protein